MRRLAALFLVAAVLGGSAPAAAQDDAFEATRSSFLDATKDVLAAVAPAIDPVNRLAARVWVTLNNVTSGGASTTLEKLVQDSVEYSVVNVRRCLYFRLQASATAAALTALVAEWAGVPQDWVVVAPDSAAARAQTPGPASQSYFTVTVTKDSIVDGPQQLDRVATLLASLPTTASGSICRKFEQLPYSNSVTLGSADCGAAITGAQVGVRYLLDVFVSLTDSNSVVAVALAAAAEQLPAGVLQFAPPEVLPMPVRATQWGAIAGLGGLSAVTGGAAAYAQYKYG